MGQAQRSRNGERHGSFSVHVSLQVHAIAMRLEGRSRTRSLRESEAGYRATELGEDGGRARIEFDPRRKRQGKYDRRDGRQRDLRRLDRQRKHRERAVDRVIRDALLCGMADGRDTPAAALGLRHIVLQVRQRVQLRRLLRKDERGGEKQVSQSAVRHGRRYRQHRVQSTTREDRRATARLLLPVELLLLLAARLRLDGERRRRPRDQPRDADRIARLLAIAVAALFDAAQGLVDFLEELPLAVARAELQRVLFLDRRLVGRIGLQFVLPQMLRGEIRLLQQFPLRLEQALAEERELFETQRELLRSEEHTSEL